jgi:hypothetical protein
LRLKDGKPLVTDNAPDIDAASNRSIRRAV